MNDANQEFGLQSKQFGALLIINHFLERLKLSNLLKNAINCNDNSHKIEWHEEWEKEKSRSTQKRKSLEKWRIVESHIPSAEGFREHPHLPRISGMSFPDHGSYFGSF
jgi:hypothetical protein